MLTSINVMAENTDFIQLKKPAENVLSKASLSNATQIQPFYCNDINAVSTTNNTISNGQYSAANEPCPTEPPSPPPTPPSPFLKSGYKILPDTSFTTQATRTESYCVRWDGQEIQAQPEQPYATSSNNDHSENTSPLNEQAKIIAHQVTSSAEFLTKETQFIAPKAINGSQCIEWRQRTVSSTSGYVSVRYGKDGVLNKPIVFVQGYGGDFTDGFTLNTVANEKEQFDKFINNSHYLKSDSNKSIYNAGYDLIVFRYAKQDTGIESNAWALATLLEKLATTSNDVRVVGHSMGGIVGKLAIMYMENTGKVHKVSDFVAIDSPFFGVHIPQDVRAFADRIESEASKLRSCTALYFYNSRKRRECRENRRRLKSINDIFDSYTFKQLDEGSTENLALRQRFNDLAIFFNPTHSTAISYGKSDLSPIPEVYTGSIDNDLKIDIKWYTSSGSHSRMYSTSNEARNGSYVPMYKTISDNIRSGDQALLSVKKETRTLNDGRHVFVTTDSAFAGKDGSFKDYIFVEKQQYKSPFKIHRDHRKVYYPEYLKHLLSLSF
jgi:pimeloyl-ACP methyl ester carboxylesterase